jgi:type IV secretion system protein VirB10
MIESRRRKRSGGLLQSLSLSVLIGLSMLAIGTAAAQDGPMAPAPAVQPQAPKPADQPATGTTPTNPNSNPPATVPNDDASADKPAPTSSDSPTLVQPAKPTPGPKITVPAGTHIPLVLHNAVSTRSARPGDPVYFETLFPIMIDGKVVIPAGSYISGEITESKRPGRVKGRGELMMKLTELILPNAYMVNLNAVPSNAGSGGNETTDKEGKIIADSNKGSDIGTIAKSAGAGAGIGGLATQSAKGVGIGAGIGAAAGLAAVLLTRGPEAELPRGSTVEAVIDRSILLDADKVQFTGPGQASALAGPPNREPVRSANPF